MQISPVWIFKENYTASYITKMLLWDTKIASYDEDIRLQRICETTGSLMWDTTNGKMKKHMCINVYVNAGQNLIKAVVGHYLLPEDSAEQVEGKTTVRFLISTLVWGLPHWALRPELTGVSAWGGRGHREQSEDEPAADKSIARSWRICTLMN